MRTLGRRLILAVLAVSGLLGLLGLVSPRAEAANVTPFTVKPPTVTGPIPSTPTDYPFIADGFGTEPRVRESNRLVREGFWLKPDAQEVIRQAAHSDVP